SAFYTLNLGIQRGSQFYNTGFSMGIEPDGSGGYKSTTVFAADQFGIYSGSEPGNYQKAFFVFNGQVFINSAFIRNGSIDNAKIGNFIQSNNYVAGSVGWRLDKSGTFENYGSTAGEGAMKQTNQTISVRDANNVLRVQIGRITGTW
ncbi:phage tail tip fiber protein, partial [Enterobacter roggenkampii]